MIIEIDASRERIGLSLRRLLPNPWDTIDNATPSAKKSGGPITNVAPFGAFVQIEDAVEGLIHASEIDGEGAVVPREKLQPGHVVKAHIISLDRQRQRMGSASRSPKKSPALSPSNRLPLPRKNPAVPPQLPNKTPYILNARTRETVRAFLCVLLSFFYRVPTKSLAQCGQYLGGKRMRPARMEAFEQRQGNHRRRHVEVDGCESTSLACLPHTP
jgi:predicted RNA-binding protein with RPS1 domain